MATLGTTSEPTDSAEAFDDSYIAFGLVLTMPSGGPWLIQNVAVWLAGYGENSTVRNVLWSGSSGAILEETATYTAVQRTFSTTGSDLYNKALLNGGYVIAGGASIIVGVRRNAGHAIFFGKRSPGSYRKNDLTTMVGNTTVNTGAIGAYITYTAANSLPTAPSWSSPAAGAIVGDTTPDLVFVHNDADDDPVASWDLQIDTTTGNGVEPDWATLSGSGREDLVNQTGGISGDTITYTSIAKTRGQWYAARARTADAVGDGAWSATRFFFINQLPTISNRNPG